MITIIVPVYNCQKYIAECLNSLINQSFNDLEIIVVDDGSIDRTAIICDDFSQKDKRIKVIHIKNSGVSTARNIGLANSRGEWVTFVDADDYVSSDYCESLYKATSTDVDMVIGRTISFDNSGLIDDGFSFTNDVRLVDDKSILYKSVFVDNPREKVVPHVSTCSSKLIRRSILEKNSIQYKSDVTIYEDAIFNIDIIYCSQRIAVINKKNYFYRMNNESSSNSIHTLLKYEMIYEKLQEYDKTYHIGYDLYENYFKIKNLNMIFKNAVNSNCLNYEFIKNTCNNGIYKKALDKVSLSSLPKRRKLLVILFRLRLYYAIYVVYKFL